MKKTFRKGLIYAAGLITMGFALIPANFPFTLALNKIISQGYTEEINLFLQDKRLDNLPLSLEEKFFFTFFPFILLLGILVLIWVVYHKKDLLSLVTGAPRFRYKSLIRAFFLWTLFSLGADMIIYLWTPENYIFSFQFLPWLKLVILGIIFIIPQITLEEVFFRSYLIKGGTLISGNPMIPMILVTLLFGLLHGANPEVKNQGFFLMMPQYMGMGLFLAYLAWSSDGLEIPLGVHLANNCWGILMVNAGGTAFETPSPVNVQSWNGLSSLAALGISILLFLILYRKTGLFPQQKIKRFYINY